MTLTMLRAVLTKAGRRDDEGLGGGGDDGDQLGISLIEHCDPLHHQMPSSSKVTFAVIISFK